ncbi:MAG: hypothetical protein PHN45_02150 [Methylococcales bacterium]|nr:hypothetical protein [Methylococcales bacterium]
MQINDADDDVNNRLDLERAKSSIRVSMCESYEGETTTTDSFVFKYTKRNPVARRKPIRFYSDDACSFDMSLRATAWFSNMTSSFLGNISPPEGSFVAGLVDENAKGTPFFYKWFVPSPEFLRLYTFVMRDEPRTAYCMMEESIKDQLDCASHWAWKFNDVLMKMSERVNIMCNENTHLYDFITGYDSTSLYCFYQMFCFGRVDDFERGSDVERMHFAVLFHYRKHVKRMLRKDADEQTRRGVVVRRRLVNGMQVAITTKK